MYWCHGVPGTVVGRQQQIGHLRRSQSACGDERSHTHFVVYMCEFIITVNSRGEVTGSKVRALLILTDTANSPTKRLYQFTLFLSVLNIFSRHYSFIYHYVS